MTRNHKMTTIIDSRMFGDDETMTMDNGSRKLVNSPQNGATWLTAEPRGLSLD